MHRTHFGLPQEAEKVTFSSQPASDSGHSRQGWQGEQQERAQLGHDPHWLQHSQQLQEGCREWCSRAVGLTAYQELKATAAGALRVLFAPSLNCLDLMMITVVT